MSDWAAIKENKQVGEGVYRLRLTAPAIAAAARPGQFIMLRVSHGLDPLLARPFSIHDVEGEDVLILFKVVGKGTRLLSMVRPGNKTLSLWGPLGQGFDLNLHRPLVVAGGMGIAPLVFASNRLMALGKNVLFYNGGGSLEEINQYKKVLMMALRRTLIKEIDYTKPQRSLSDDYTDFIIGSSTDDGSYGYRGFVPGLLELGLNANKKYHDGVLTCGPMPMLKAVAAICAQHQVPCQVSLEAPMACGLGACLGCAIPAAGGGYLRACQEGPVMDAALVDWARL